MQRRNGPHFFLVMDQWTSFCPFTYNLGLICYLRQHMSFVELRGLQSSSLKASWDRVRCVIRCYYMWYLHFYLVWCIFHVSGRRDAVLLSLTTLCIPAAWCFVLLYDTCVTATQSIFLSFQIVYFFRLFSSVSLGLLFHALWYYIKLFHPVIWSVFQKCSWSVSSNPVFFINI